MKSGLKERTVVSIIVVVVVGFGVVMAEDVIVKQGTIGTGNASPDSRAKVFITDGPASTYYQDYGLLTVTTPTDGTDNNYGMLCEFFPDASSAGWGWGKYGAWFFNYPVGTQNPDGMWYYSVFGHTAGKPGAYTISDGSVGLTGVGAGAGNPNNVAGSSDYYLTEAVYAYSSPVSDGNVMTGSLTFANYGLEVYAMLDGDYQATSGTGQNFGAYIETSDFLDASAAAIINSYALYLKPFTTNYSLHGGQTYGLYQEGAGVENRFEGNLTVDGFFDNTPGYSGTPQDALNEVLNVKSVDGQIDHSSLPALARGTVHRVEKTNRRVVKRTDPVGNAIQKEQYDVSIVEEEGRNLGGMITVLTEAVKGLNEKLEALEAENQALKAEIAALKATATPP